MVYMGSKRKIAKYILPFLQEHLTGQNYFVDIMCGGCNLIDKLDYPLKVANDSNEYLIALFKALQEGWTPPEYINKEEYLEAKEYQFTLPNYFIGYVGLNCSFNGKWFNGYCGNGHVRKDGRVENHQTEKRNGLLKQMESLKDVVFMNKSYSDITFPKPCVIYCDPPYEGTTKYKDDFDHTVFWQWCRDMSAKGHKVFISEYNAPPDFTCVWGMEVTVSLATTKTHKPVEKLFTLKD